MPSEAISTLELRTRHEWREWLQANHDSVSEIWLVFHKNTAKPPIGYEDAVEEALCFGWIDSLVKRLDESRYARKFTPRKADSRWSTINRRRYAKLKARGMLAPPGVARPPTSRSGDALRPRASVAHYIEGRLQTNKRAWRHYERLAPSYRRAYIAWIDSAKQAQTRERRIREALVLLAAGRKLGLK